MSIESGGWGADRVVGIDIREENIRRAVLLLAAAVLNRVPVDVDPGDLARRLPEDRCPNPSPLARSSTMRSRTSNAAQR